MVDDDGGAQEDDDLLAEGSEDEETRPQFRYQAGYLLEEDSPVYLRIPETVTSMREPAWE